MRGANCKHDVWSVIALGRYVGTLFLPMLGMVWRYQLVWIMDAHMPWQERILVAIRQTRCRPNSTDGWTLEALAHCFLQTFLRLFNNISCSRFFPHEWQTLAHIWVFMITTYLPKKNLWSLTKSIFCIFALFFC